MGEGGSGGSRELLKYLITGRLRNQYKSWVCGVVGYHIRLTVSGRTRKVPGSIPGGPIMLFALLFPPNCFLPRPFLYLIAVGETTAQNPSIRPGPRPAPLARRPRCALTMWTPGAPPRPPRRRRAPQAGRPAPARRPPGGAGHRPGPGPPAGVPGPRVRVPPGRPGSESAAAGSPHGPPS